MRRGRSSFWVIALALAVAAPAFAQPPGLQQQTAQAERREKVKRRIEQVRNAALIDKLGLDEQTAGRLLLVYAKYDDLIEKELIARAEILNRLKNAEHMPKPEVDHAIDDAVANQGALRDLELKRLAEIRKILTPAQTARLLVVLPAIERRIQNQLLRAIQGGKKAGPRHPPPPPANDDDDDLDE